MSHKRFSLCVAISISCHVVIASAGCNSDTELGTVQGRVTKDGKPLPKLWVEFRPAAGRPAEGRTDSNGHYELRYTMDKKGAVAGKNRVSISSGGETDSRDNELSPRREIYSGEVEVESGSNELDFSIGN